MADKLSESGSGDSDSSPSDDRKSRENTPESSPFRQPVRSHKRRRRRHLNSKDSNPDSDLSELEETALRTIGALDISTDCSGDDNSEYESSRSSQEQDCDNKTLNLKAGRVAGAECELLEARDEGAAWSCLQQLYQHSPIQTCKVLCDVLDANQAMLQSCSLDQSQVQALVELLNLCVKVENELMSDSRWNSKFMKRGFEAEWQQRIPLPADWTLLHFPLLAPIHRDMIFSANCKQLSASESCFLCLQRMIAFGVRTARTTNLISFDCQALTFALPPLQKQAVARTPLVKALRSALSAKSSDPKDL